MAPSTFRTPLPLIESQTPKGVALRIREATIEDTATIIALIKALAEYEKEPEAAQATPETIRENIFEKGYGECVIAELKEQEQWKPVGFAVFCFKFSTWTSKPSLYLEDLFVLEQYRNHKIGTALFRVLGQVAQDRKCARIDFEVLDWNAPSIAFYENVLKAQARPGWTQMRLEGDAIANLAKLGA